MTTIVSNKSFIDELPLELTTHIFSFLDPKDYLLIRRVCKGWKDLLTQRDLWKSFLLKKFGFQNQPDENFFISRVVTSYQQFIRSVKEFCSTVGDNQQGSLTCFFQSNFSDRINIIYGRNRSSIIPKPISDISDFYIFPTVNNDTDNRTSEQVIKAMEINRIPYSYIYMKANIPNEFIKRDEEHSETIHQYLSRKIVNIFSKLFGHNKTHF